jgi:hypothetical protein
MFKKVKQGFWGTHKMPCWRKMTVNKVKGKRVKG